MLPVTLSALAVGVDVLLQTASAPRRMFGAMVTADVVVFVIKPEVRVMVETPFR